MNNKKLKSESGQAIVYLVLGLIVFLGFVALAIDAGMAMADRRHEQNSADAASLAGGGAAATTLDSIPYQCYATWVCNNNDQYMIDAETAAQNRALANGFTITSTGNPADNNNVIAKCGSIQHGGYTDKYIDVTVDISATTPSNFLQLISPNALQNDVKSTTRIRPEQPVGFGNAIIALNDANCNGQQFGVNVSGGSDTLVEGGGIFSNGCLSGNGSFQVDITGGAGAAGHDVQPGDPNNWNPQPVTTDLKLTASDLGIPTPNCNDPAANHKNAGQLPTDLTPGLWCVTGNIKLEGAGGILHGTNVTLVVLDGVFDASGNADVQLSAYPITSTVASPAIPGVVIYVPSTNTNTITLNGNSSSFYHGTVFAPKSDIKMDGTGDQIFSQSQVIGLNVFLSGNATTKVSYDRCTSRTQPAFLELNK